MNNTEMNEENNIKQKRKMFTLNIRKKHKQKFYRQNRSRLFQKMNINLEGGENSLISSKGKTWLNFFLNKIRDYQSKKLPRKYRKNQ
jgi:hypothetical protein